MECEKSNILESVYCMDRFSAVILAAGEGTRMKSSTPKVLHKILGKPIISWIVDALTTAQADDILTVVGHGKEQVMEHLDGKVKFGVQEQQLGTGHAVMQVRDQIGSSSTVLVLCGDTPLIGSESINEIYEHHKNAGNSVTVVSAELDNPFGYGRIVKNGSGNLLKIVEQKDATPQESLICEINSGMYMFEKSALLGALDSLRNDNAQGEYYLTDTVELILKGGGKAGTYIMKDSRDILGINNRVQLAEAAKILKQRVNENYMLDGVTIVDPENTYIEPGAVIGKDTVIEPNCQIKAGSHIGSECVIGPDTIINNSTVGDRTTVLKAVVNDSKIGADTTVGPFAYIRPNSDIGSHVKIGDFVEIKKSIIGDNTKVSHLTYIGDAQVGERVNFGCGTITVNYDGKNKFQTVIEDDAFIGCNTNLVAPVTVREHSFIAAGSTIHKEVPKNALAISRVRQENKEEWVLKRDEKRNGGK